jgi:hypothetical protein
LVGSSIAVTCHNVHATFVVGANSAENRVQIAEPVPGVKVRTEPLPTLEFLHALEGHFGTPYGQVHETLAKFMVVDEGITLKSYLKDAEAVALAKDIFNWKALRVSNPLKEDSYIQYDDSFSTDGEQVAVHFRSDMNAAEVKEVEREEHRKSHHLKKPEKTEKLFTASAKGTAQQAGINEIMQQQPTATFEKLVTDTVRPFIRQCIDNYESVSASTATASAIANPTADAAAASAALSRPHDGRTVRYIATDPGEIEILSLSGIELRSREDAERANLFAKIDQAIDQPAVSSFQFSTEEYKKQSGFQESKARYDKDLQKPQYASLRTYLRTGRSPRVAESTAYKEHIEELMQEFDNLCSLHLHRNRVVGRFKSDRAHQSAWDNIANDIMRGKNTMKCPKGKEKPPRHNTVLCHGLSLQSRALKHHQNAPHHRLLRVLCRRRNRNEPVLLVFFVKEPGSSKYCCACSSELGPMDANRMRACTNHECPISTTKIDRDRSASINLMRFGVWAMFHEDRPPPFGAGGGDSDDQLSGEDIA